MNRSSLGKIAVVGSGAVGCCYGGMLAHAGRNVHFLMRADLDTVRREVARVALNKLIFDGRIQPGRIEEVVAKAISECSLSGQVCETEFLILHNNSPTGLEKSTPRET